MVIDPHRILHKSLDVFDIDVINRHDHRKKVRERHKILEYKLFASVVHFPFSATLAVFDNSFIDKFSQHMLQWLPIWDSRENYDLKNCASMRKIKRTNCFRWVSWEWGLKWRKKMDKNPFHKGYEAERIIETADRWETSSSTSFTDLKRTMNNIALALHVEMANNRTATIIKDEPNYWITVFVFTLDFSNAFDALHPTVPECAESFMFYLTRCINEKIYYAQFLSPPSHFTCSAATLSLNSQQTHKLKIV